MDTIRTLTDPALVARIQRVFGIELIKPGTCDQQTQTKRPSLSRSNSEQIPGDGTNISCEKCSVCGKDNSVGCEQNVSSEVIGSSSRSKGANDRDTEPNNNGTDTVSKQSCFDVTHRLKAEQVEQIDGERKSQINHCCNGHEINSCDAKASENAADWAYPGKSSAFGERANKTGNKQAVRIKYKSLFYLAHFGAFLGNEEFYLTFFPFCMWNLDSLIVRQVSLLWALTMYLGQATKDYLRWPRPQCPPVVRLETSYLQEFSMPSTHAMAGTAIPMYLAYLVIVRYQVSIPLAVTVALLWYCTTCFSRLYLGVHTVLDLIIGTLFAIIVFFTFIRYVEDYDLYQQKHQFAPVMIVMTALLFCTFFYPKDGKNSSKGDAVQIVSAMAGSSIGSWIAYQFEYVHEPEILKPYEIQAPTLLWLLLSILRFISGLVLLGICYIPIRKFTIQFFSYLYGLDVPDKNNPSVLTAYKFTTYFALGWIITFIIPLFHVWLKIERASYFTEVL